MIRVSIEVGAGAVRFLMGVRAQSIERAVSLAQELYPAADVRVKFPIDSESFFVIEDCAAELALVEAQLPHKKMAA